MEHKATPRRKSSWGMLTPLVPLVLLLAIFLITPSVVIADEIIKGWSPSYIEPSYAAGCDTDAHEMAMCVGRTVKHSEGFLKRLIRDIAKLIPEEQIEPFTKSNTLWFQFRDASCEFDAATAGGSSRSIRFGDCMHRYNKTRIELLSKYHYCVKGGDCPNDFHLYYMVR